MWLQLWQIVCQSDDGSATLHDVDVETYAECSRGPGFCSGRPVSSLYVKGHYVFYTCYIVNMADFLPQPYAVLVFLLFVLPFCIGIGVSIAGTLRLTQILCLAYKMKPLQTDHANQQDFYNNTTNQNESSSFQTAILASNWTAA